MWGVVGGREEESRRLRTAYAWSLKVLIVSFRRYGARGEANAVATGAVVGCAGQHRKSNECIRNTPGMVRLVPRSAGSWLPDTYFSTLPYCLGTSSTRKAFAYSFRTELSRGHKKLQLYRLQATHLGIVFFTIQFQQAK